MQLGTRRSDGSCEAAEDLISGFSAIEAEAELVQVRLKLCTAAVISAEQERLKTSAKFFKRDALCSCHANDLQRFSEIIVAYFVSNTVDYCIYFALGCVKPICTFI